MTAVKRGGAVSGEKRWSGEKWWWLVEIENSLGGGGGWWWWWLVEIENSLGRIPRGVRNGEEKNRLREGGYGEVVVVVVGS